MVREELSMRNPLNKRLPRELKHDFGKYLVIFLFMVMMISLVSGFLVADNSVKHSYDEGFEKYNLEDGHFTLDKEPDSSLIKDIENKIIRCVGVPIDRFTEDPLRIMRAVRFAAQLGFHIENYTNIAMVQTNDGLSKISAERIQSELCKILISDHPEYVLNYYIDISPAIPELSKIMGCSQNNMYHIYDVWNHTRFALTAWFGTI